MRTQTTSSESVEMYLKTIAELEDQATPVVIARVAERLGVTPVSANEMMKRLAAQELISHQPYKGVELTDDGRLIAYRVIRRQRLWECFLVDYLKLEWAGVYEAACSLEHATSDLLADALDAYIDYPAVCPHGNPIPTAEGTMAPIKGCSLNELSPGECARILSIRPTGTEVFAYLQQHNILPNQEITVVEVAPMQGPITLDLNDGQVALGLAMAALVMVCPLKQTNNVI